MEYTTDFIYGNRLKIKQPKEGFRVSIDSILLASAVQAEEGDSVLDVGAGIGGSSLCLAVRCPKVRVLGIELQRENVSLAFDNIQSNNLKGRVEVLCGDLLKPPPKLAAGTYSHVMTNPPFYNEDQIRLPQNLNKYRSNVLQNITLEQWLNFTVTMVKHNGQVTLIHLPEYLDRILKFFSDRLGSITVFPIWSYNKTKAKRVIIRGIKGSNGLTEIQKGLVLHRDNYSYTNEAESLLRHGKALAI